MTSSGIKYLRECCADMGITCDELFYTGQGKTYYKRGRNVERFVFAINRTKVKDTQKYFIKFFSAHKFYLCWKSDTKRREVFSARKDDVYLALASNQNEFRKAIEFVNRDTEIVYIIKESGLKAFLTTYLL